MQRITLALMAAMFIGCATQGGGLTYPITINGQKVLVNSASVLTMEAAQCNAEAQVEYNLNVELCSGVLMSQLPYQTAQAEAAVQALCVAYGYTQSGVTPPQLIVPPTVQLIGCVAPTAMPTAAPAPGM